MIDLRFFQAERSKGSFLASIHLSAENEVEGVVEGVEGETLRVCIKKG